jgi:hypothetical protein
MPSAGGKHVPSSTTVDQVVSCSMSDLLPEVLRKEFQRLAV